MQIDIFRSVIHPEVVIRASETDLAVLDLRQERNARVLGGGHRIVYGVAGSGKTVLLIARAKLLAEDPQKRILILCYNRSRQHLAVALAGHRRLTVTTFHCWAGRCGVDRDLAARRPGDRRTTLSVWSPATSLCSIPGGVRMPL